MGSAVSDDLRSLLVRAQSSGDHHHIAKLLTAVERAGPAALAIDELLTPKTAAFRIGVTGPPGAGKSTLINRLLSRLRDKRLKIAVLAVDPTSPVTSGAVLGDRIRFTE